MATTVKVNYEVADTTWWGSGGLDLFKAFVEQTVSDDQDAFIANAEQLDAFLALAEQIDDWTGDSSDSCPVTIYED